MKQKEINNIKKPYINGETGITLGNWIKDTIENWVKRNPDKILENALNELIQQQTKFLKKLGGTYGKEKRINKGRKRKN